MCGLVPSVGWTFLLRPLPSNAQAGLGRQAPIHLAGLRCSHTFVSLLKEQLQVQLEDDVQQMQLRATTDASGAFLVAVPHRFLSQTSRDPRAATQLHF